MTDERTARTIMVQGTASSVGKSVLAAALCRIFFQDGLRVAPFKAQNMSLNSFATPDGGEIGRAQAVQAEAAMVAPTVEMNPILLKPEGDNRSQVVVRGKPLRALPAKEYYSLKEHLWPVVAEALDRLRAEYDIVVIEGAGGAAEVNLRAHEIVNMRVARYAQAPVLLVGDIDRGGVFASLVGTMELLEPEERDLIKGFVINKFRGDPSLLDTGLEMLDRRTGVPVLGVLPYFTHIYIPEEDSVALERRRGMKAKTGYVLDIAVIGFPHISNFDDFDPLNREEGVRLRYVEAGDALGNPDLVILPGTKSTMADLEYIQGMGLAEQVVAHARSGAPVIGICGGYQMLGVRLLDPDGVESHRAEAAGLGLLPVTTVFQDAKATQQTEARVTAEHGLLADCAGVTLKGYEIHMGKSQAHPARAPFQITRRSGRPVNDSDGAMDAEGMVLGTYMHGLFHNDTLRRRLLARLAARKGVQLPPSMPPLDASEEFDKLAAFVRQHLDMERLYGITGLRGAAP